MKLLCFLGLHKWSDTFTTYEHTEKGKVAVTCAKCARCGKVKF